MIKRDYGQIEYDGDMIKFTDDPFRTNRVFPYCYNDVPMGYEYTDEWEQAGINENGNPVSIYWQFDQIKGQEVEDDALDWYESSNIVDVIVGEDY